MSFQEYADSFVGKLHLGDVNKKVISGIAVILGIAVIGICLGFANLDGTSNADAIVAKSAEESASLSEEPKESARVEDICVHIGGCVAIPGVVTLPEGARVSDAVAAAGGLTDDAAQESVNLARIVEDGEQVIVPSVTQVQAAAVNSESAQLQDSATPGASTQGTGKVNLNTASSTELQTLSGIGASKAQKIIAYRESNGTFKSVDDLTKVSGIGEKTLESIRDQICV